MREFTRKMLTVIQVIFARLRFIAIFIIAALLVGNWDHIKNYYDKWTRPTVDSSRCRPRFAGRCRCGSD
jgi:hypothetical protein